MSFRWSNGLVRRFREAAQADEARQRIAASTVRGRHLGCTVVYNGLGRVLSLELDESHPRLTENGSPHYRNIEAAVKGAVLDAQEKMNSVRQAEWAKVNRRLLTQHANSTELLGPYPHEWLRTQCDRALLDFPHALSGATVEFGVPMAEALQRREAVRNGLERLWQTGAARIDERARAAHEARGARGDRRRRKEKQEAEGGEEKSAE
eukprot:TRINITY_DN26008_c0_g1_i1.p3 TRINITY_DN26008_c0_g1~~TRINITY_DN26008_c0_g1_i1.p3  ORF type:complete len:238 (+),score=92.59 TRINITY_DN26008_c0_g1_i1:96-716(+)